ncbi:MAG: M48 family metalloprotease, partial [Acidimicrobiales bacterium]
MADRLDGQVPANRRRALVLATGPGALVLLIGFFVTWALSFLVLAVVVGVVAGGAVTAAVRMAGPRIVIHLVGATPAGPDEQPRVHNLLDGLCVAAGVAKPEVLVVVDDAPNALVVANNQRRGALVVTTGLVEGLSRIELEGVLAHELSHLESGDALPATVAVAALWPLVAVFPRAASLLERLAGPDREERADAAAASLTRYPPGLAQALAAVQQGA